VPLKLNSSIDMLVLVNQLKLIGIAAHRSYQKVHSTKAISLSI
jgi:hypothetical protein